MSETPKFEPPAGPVQLPFASRGSALTRPVGWKEIRAVIVGGALVVTALWSAYTTVMNNARAEVDGGVRPLVTRVEAVEVRQRSTDDEVRAVKAEVNSLRVETQADLRALYKAVMTGRPQPRLEDAGSP